MQTAGKSQSKGLGVGRHITVTGVLFSFAVIVAIVTVMVLTALERVAENANLLDDERSRETTIGALKTFEDQLGATLDDYAAWDDAAANVYSPDGMPVVPIFCGKGLVGIAEIAGYFAAEPSGQRWIVCLCGHLDLGNHKAAMFAGKDVDLPDETLMRNAVTRLLDDDADRVLQQFLGIGDRDVVFEFVTGDGAAADLDRQSRLPAIEDTHPDGTIVHADCSPPSGRRRRR